MGAPKHVRSPLDPHIVQPSPPLSAQRERQVCRDGPRGQDQRARERSPVARPGELRQRLPQQLAPGPARSTVQISRWTAGFPPSLRSQPLHAHALEGGTPAPLGQGPKLQHRAGSAINGHAAIPRPGCGVCAGTAVGKSGSSGRCPDPPKVEPAKRPNGLTGLDPWVLYRPKGNAVSGFPLPVARRVGIHSGEGAIADYAPDEVPMTRRPEDSPGLADSNEQDDALGFAGVMAHQLRSPISTASSLLDVLAYGYNGPLNPQQRKTLARTRVCLDESLRAMCRLLEIARPMSAEERECSLADALACLPRAEEAIRQALGDHCISFRVRTDLSHAYVRASEPTLVEVMTALLNNAVKYTPDNGHIRVDVAASPEGMIRISVGDSGIGIPEENREHVFEPFFRTAAARGSDRPGIGLGLAFVKSLVTKFGGEIRAATSDLGGAMLTVDLPAMPEPEPGDGAGQHHAPSLTVVIIGGVAAGPKVAAKTVRLVPDADVTIVERGKVMSYAGCGLPYYVSGAVRDERELTSSPVGIVRDSVFFRKVKNVHVRGTTEALEIDRQAKRVRIRSEIGGTESWLPYDKLVLATGASPIIPGIPGVDRPGVFTLHGMSDAEGIRASLATEKARDVVIVGGGLIGVEMTEALVRRGCRVTIVERDPRVLGILDPEIAVLVERHMEANGVRVMTDTDVLSIEQRGPAVDTGSLVRTNQGELLADMVILAVGVQPNVDLARQAGLAIGPDTGAIQVDGCLCTSDPDIYAAGDCVECRDLITGEHCHVPLGSTANKQGRVAAVNLCGGDEVFPGVLGSTACKVFDYCVARTGLTERHAREKGYRAIPVLAPAPDRAHYLASAKTLMLKLVVEDGTGRLLGAQATGPGDGVKRIDVAAMAITAGMTVHDLANADLCYAPPYSSAMDNLIAAANVARNKLDGHMVGISAAEVKSRLDAEEDILLLDLRTPAEFEERRLPGAVNVPLASLRGRLSELPRDKEIVAFCEISLRGYEGSLVLRANGFTNVKVMDGGMVMWPYETF
jgi:NADPH-dependent 2,4-dienoyl-CoA reductase/sulfur reductase-like enzyme/rhodanese-related sulfurtransferase